MPALLGVDHIGLSVTDLDRSERFYTEVFDLTRIVDFGYGRILLHQPTSFIVGIATPEGALGGPFTELTTGLDHIGFTASSRAELVEWETKLDRLGVAYTPIRDMEFGHHLNFRDPDNIALEIMALNELAASWLAEFREDNLPQPQIESRFNDYLASLASDSDRG
jgi:glyoxylase I family protein